MGEETRVFDGGGAGGVGIRLLARRWMDIPAEDFFAVRVTHTLSITPALRRNLVRCALATISVRRRNAPILGKDCVSQAHCLPLGRICLDKGRGL